MDILIICLGQIWRTEVKTFYIWAEIKCNKNGRVMSVFKHLNQINGTEELASPQLQGVHQILCFFKDFNIYSGLCFLSMSVCVHTPGR